MGSFDLDGLTPWKKRRDKFQDSDNVSGMGDQVQDFDEQGHNQLTGSPKGASFIRKDETNVDAMKAMNMELWWREKKIEKKRQKNKGLLIKGHLRLQGK